MPIVRLLPLCTLLLADLLHGRPPDSLFAVLRFESETKAEYEGWKCNPPDTAFLPSYNYLFIN
jgi:hypothetical protein